MKKVWIPLLLVLVVCGFFYWMGGGDVSGVEVVQVEKQTVARTVSETGVIEPEKKLSLGFPVGGRVEALPFSQGQSVAKGAVLATLEASQRRAGILQAQAQVGASRARLLDAKNRVSAEDRNATEANIKTAEVALESTKTQQDLAVENALQAFLNTDLRAYLEDGNVSKGEVDTPPFISGTYTSEERGKYVLELYRSNALSGYSYTFAFINQEGEKVKDDIGSVSTEGPEPLGERGLYLEFPEDFVTGGEVKWIIPIPNTRSASYVIARNAYEQALEGRESAILNAQANLESVKTNAKKALQPTSVYTLEALRATLQASEASLASAQDALQDTVLVAPITGTIAEISIDKGEITSPGAPVVTLLSQDTFRVEVDIPEADIVGLNVGDTAEVTFDAYDDLSLPAKVTFISPQAVTKQGVTAVEVELGFESTDERLKSGITADVDIHTSEKKNVLAIPSRAVIEMNEEKFVHILPDGVKKNMLTMKNIAEKVKKVQVTTGLRGTSGLVEITAGLSGGERVVSFLPEAMRKALQEENENKELGEE